ncbi:hypothetical protein [Streptomyces asiaticus]
MRPPLLHRAWTLPRRSRTTQLGEELACAAPGLVHSGTGGPSPFAGV